MTVIVSSAGVQGPRGNTVLSGTGAPGSTVGIDGDYYVDTTNYPTSATLYGPRVSGAWPGTGIIIGGGGGGITPATTVVAGITYGQMTAVGTDTTYAREDHSHGTPPLTSTPPATTLGIGQAAAVGTATAPARADHVHPLAAAGAPAASAVTSVQATGVATTFSASDHVHGREGFGAVTAQTSFGASSATGTATTVAHSDHAHGTPTLPNATTGAAGVLQLAGDLGGTASSPTVVSTHLTSALPLAQGGTGQATASAAYNALAPTTTLGDIAYASGAGTNTRLPGATSATKQYLQQTGTGTVSAAPAWGAIAAGDLPAATTGSEGIVQLAGDLGGTASAPQVVSTHLSAALPLAQGGTAATSAGGARTSLGLGTAAVAAIDPTPTDIQPLGVQAAGATGQVADAGHVHPMPRLDQVAAPTASVGLNSQKLTSMLAGVSGTDGANVAQLPAAASSSVTGLVRLTGDLGGTATSPTITSTHLASALPVAQGGTASSSRTWAGLLTPTAVKTGAYSAAAGDFVPVDTTSGAVTVTLPTAPADLTVVAVKMIATATVPNAVSVVTGGSDVFNKAGGGTSLTLSLPSQAVQVQYSAASSIWYVLDDDLPLGQLDARYQRVITVATATGVSATDAASIAAAVTAAGVGGTLYFPQGTYVCDSLAPLSGQTWYGPATIQRPASSTNSVITATGLSGFTMRQLTVDGNRANSTATSNAAIYLINTTGTQLVGLTVQNTPSANAGIILRGSVRGLVDACQLTTVGYGVLLGLNHGDVYSCYGNIIRGCTIDTTDADAIFLSENLGSTTSISVVGSVIGTVVTGCTVRGFGDCGIEIGSGTVYTEVSGCTFVGISNGVGNNGILFRDAVHGSVTGCTVSNLTKTGSTGVYMVNLNGSNQHNSVNSTDVYNCGYGYIVVGGTSGGSVGTAAIDISFNGGVIDTTAIDGIHLNNVNGFSITGTRVRSAGQQGISVGKFSTSSATDGTITGVSVFNSSQLTTGDSGIILFQNSADIVITGCRIGDNQGGSKTQAYGIRIFDTTVTNVTVSNTDLTNGGTTSNFTSAPAAGSGIQVLNCPGTTPSALPNVITQPGASAEPSDHGLIAWSYDAGLASQSSTTVSGGTLYLTAVYPRQAFNSTKAYFSVATVGVTPTAGDNWIGLYNQSGTLLASKGIDSNVTAGVGLQTITWTSATGVQPAGQYWIGFFFNAGTEPTLYRAPTPTDNATQNVGLTTTNYRMCQQAGGFTTALPSPLIVASNSISGSPRLWWVALG